MRIVVCPLRVLVRTVTDHGAGQVISLLSEAEMALVPADLTPGRHLKVAVNDIDAPRPGLVAPGPEHAGAIIDFARGCADGRPLVIHCYAGISRSPAAALIAACALAPDADEASLAGALRGAAPFAKPNPLLIAHADAALGRGGRLIAAIGAMAPPALAFEGAAFALDPQPGTQP